MIALASHIWLRCFRYAWEEPHSGTPSVHSHFEGTYFYSAVVQHPRLGFLGAVATGDDGGLANIHAMHVWPGPSGRMQRTDRQRE